MNEWSTDAGSLWMLLQFQPNSCLPSSILWVSRHPLIDCLTYITTPLPLGLVKAGSSIHWTPTGQALSPFEPSRLPIHKNCQIYTKLDKCRLQSLDIQIMGRMMYQAEEGDSLKLILTRKSYKHVLERALCVFHGSLSSNAQYDFHCYEILPKSSALILKIILAWRCAKGILQ